MRIDTRATTLACTATLALLANLPVAAQGVRTEHNISLAMANEAVMAAVDSCLKSGYNVSASVVDRAGQVKAIARGDGSGPHTPDTSRRKAYTALTTRTPTAVVAENWQKNPASQNLVYITDVLAVGGGVPIKMGTETIGAIGVSGAPGGQLDEACGQAGIDKLKDRLASGS